MVESPETELGRACGLCLYGIASVPELAIDPLSLGVGSDRALGYPLGGIFTTRDELGRAPVGGGFGCSTAEPADEAELAGAAELAATLGAGLAELGGQATLAAGLGAAQLAAAAELEPQLSPQPAAPQASSSALAAQLAELQVA